MMNKWFIIAGLLSLIAVAVGGDRHGYNRAMDKAEAEQAEAIREALEVRDLRQRQQAAIARRVISTESEIQEQGEALQREAREYARDSDNPVCFDGERLRRVRSAIRGSSAATD
jgi:hypothetical protein